MVATDSQHVAIPAIFGKHEKAVRGARPELAKAPLSLKLSSPTMPPPAVTVAVDTPSCSPAATPPAGPGQPYGPEVHDEEHLVGAPEGRVRGAAPAQVRDRSSLALLHLADFLVPGLQDHAGASHFVAAARHAGLDEGLIGTLAAVRALKHSTIGVSTQPGENTVCKRSCSPACPCSAGTRPRARSPSPAATRQRGHAGRCESTPCSSS